MAQRDDGGQRGSPAKRVLQTGIALVHRGEVVLPAAGSEAQAVRVVDDARQEIHYHFPVEIVVSADDPAADGPDAHVNRALAALAARLRNLH